MKHLVAILALFLLLGNQTLAQNTPPETLTPIQKIVLCGPGPAILLGIKKYGEKPRVVFKNQGEDIQTLVFFNDETGTGTIIDVMPDKVDLMGMTKIWCIISHGVNGWSENFGPKA